MLTYTDERIVQPAVRERVVVTLQAPTSWGMFTKEGDRAITKKAKALITKMSTDKSYVENVKHLFSFLRAYRSMGKSKSFGEADDTDVREQVWDFFKRACRCIGIDRDGADALWERS